jgi:hypothetical protein
MLHCPPISDLSRGYGSLPSEPAGDVSCELTQQVTQVRGVPECASQSGSDVTATKSLDYIFSKH